MLEQLANQEITKLKQRFLESFIAFGQEILDEIEESEATPLEKLVFLTRNLRTLQALRNDPEKEAKRSDLFYV